MLRLDEDLEDIGMRLYYFPLSSYSQKALIAFAEKEVGYTREVVDIRNAAAREGYRKLYRLGKIPMLIADDGEMIAESSIIIEYLDYHFASGTCLIPSDPDSAREMRFHDRNADLYLNESITTLHREGLKPEANQNADAIAQAQFRIRVMYDYLDDRLKHRTWIMGDDFTMADCAMAPPLSYAQYVAPFGDRGNIASYWRKLEARPSFRGVLDEARPYLEQFKNAAGYR